MKKRLEAKVLSFSTTMRNPYRIIGFMECIKDFNAFVLNHECIIDIVKAVIKNKLYKPKIIEEIPSLSLKYKDEDSVFSDDDLEYIINNSSQKHKEAGFEKGWESRFDTWYALCKELGFLYYEKDKKIQISQLGYSLCDFSQKEEYQQVESIFLNVFVKWQSNNPFRRNLNAISPIPLLINTIYELRANNINFNGIYKKELSFLLCWNNNDYLKLSHFIDNFRKEYGLRVGDEIYYQECLKLLNTKNTKRFKINQIMSEGIDDLIRKLRITGLFSLRGMGQFLDINYSKKDLADYIVSTYSNPPTFYDTYQFYQYMQDIDTNIIKYSSQKNQLDKKGIKLKVLKEFAKKYTKAHISKELKALSNKNAKSQDEYLKLIELPTRFEFLTSILLCQNLDSRYEVIPNYAVDDFGNPTFTARGGVADIEVYDKKTNSIVEVTLLRDKKQSIVEIPAITRHLQAINQDNKEECFCVFIAPIIHADTRYMCDFSNYKYSLEIYPYTIIDFVDKINQTNDFSKMRFIG